MELHFGGNDLKVFGASLGDMNNSFFIALNDSILAYLTFIGDRLITLDPEFDQNKQDEQIDRLIDYGIDGLFLVPVDWKKVKSVLLKLQAAGIPVFNVDTAVYNEELVVNIVTSNNYEAGVLNAEYMMKIMDYAKIAIL